jgi:hypothetical protein
MNRIEYVDHYAWAWVCDLIDDTAMLRTVLAMGTDDESLDKLRDASRRLEADLSKYQTRKDRLMSDYEDEPDANFRHDIRAKITLVNTEMETARRSVEAIRRRIDEAESRRREADQTVAAIRSMASVKADEALKTRVGKMVGLRTTISVADQARTLTLGFETMDLGVEATDHLPERYGRSHPLPWGKGKVLRFSK